MGYEEYGTAFHKRLVVEKRRQQDYEKSKSLIAEINNQIPR
ncbi:hypothetical protein ACFFIS_09140 [Virgibacillus soli]